MFKIETAMCLMLIFFATVGLIVTWPSLEKEIKAIRDEINQSDNRK